MPKSQKITTVVIIILVTLGSIYWLQAKHRTVQQNGTGNIQTIPPTASQSTEIMSGNTRTNSETENVPTTTVTWVTIMVPENMDTYRKQMTEFVQVGGTDPLKTTKFIPKIIPVLPTTDIIQASATAAAEQFTANGGPGKVTLNYLKIQDGTAYVLLNIDLDWWAGVSVSLAIIHPVVEKTILQFPAIHTVVFGYAPWDK